MADHQGHRARARRRYVEKGAGGLSDRELLELALFSAVPRGDVNPLADALLERFGSLRGVLEAGLPELLEVRGVGENTAVFLSLLPELARRAGLGERPQIRSSRDAGAVLAPKFAGETREALYALCLDGDRRVISCALLARGEADRAQIRAGQVLEYAQAQGASFVVLAHNHPGGIAVPSREDEESTRVLAEHLAESGIRLLDHLVVSGDDFVSMSDDGKVPGGRMVR